MSNYTPSLSIIKTPILGSAYTARSVNAACNRMVNLYPEIVPEGGKEAAFLTRCPGLTLKGNAGDGPIRGEWGFGGYAYIVSGDELYKMSSDYTSVLLGRVSGSGPVSMADNGTQLFISCNPEAFIYNASTNVYAQITDIDFPGSVTVAYLKGNFIFNEPDSQKLWSTKLLDGTSIDPLAFSSTETSPDLLSSVFVNHQELWGFGTNSTEIWYNSGNTDFPLSPIEGAFIELGIDAPYSVAQLDNTVFWLGGDNRGRGIVYRASGYRGERVSTHAIEWQIQSYGDISDAIAYSYQQEGHSFYVLTFPTVGKTWVYDVSTTSWHERQGFDNGLFVRQRPNSQLVFNNEILLGDYENGNIYAYDLDNYTDNGDAVKWLRSWRAFKTGGNNLKRSAHHSLQLDIETGVGLSSGQGSDPQVMLRWSDDGGHTWSAENWRSMGEIGAYSTRVIWRRLGMTIKIRDRVYEVSGTDPVKVTIMGAELGATGTYS